MPRWVDHEVRRSRPSWSIFRMKPFGETPSLLKIQKIRGAWWRVPVIPATREAEAGESLEPGRQRLHEPRSCYCTPAWATDPDSVSNKQTNKQISTNYLMIIPSRCGPWTLISLPSSVVVWDGPSDPLLAKRI